MKYSFQIGAVILAIGLGACTTETTTTTTKTKTAHYEPSLGSHVPRSENTTSSTQAVNPSAAGDRAFAGGSAAGMGGSGGGR